MIVSCLKCGVDIHSEEGLTEGEAFEVKCPDCGSIQSITASTVIHEADLNKATNMISDVSKGMDVEAVIDMYLGK